MGFSGGGSNILKAHTHNGLTVQDGGALDFDDITQSQSSAGMVFYSDGTHLQQLAYPGSPAGETLTAAALSSAPSWGAAGGAFTNEGSDTEAVLTTQLQVSGLSDKDFFQVFYNISTNASSTDPTHFGVRLNGSSAANYGSVKVQAVNAASPTTAEVNGGTYWRISANLYNYAVNTCMGVITIYKSQPGQLGAGAMYRAESANTSNAVQEWVTYSSGINASITGAITSIELMVENASILGSMQVNGGSWT